MQDFIRIGGPVTSSPLNENFRRLLNAISIANTNLVFSEEHGIVNTLDDMMALINSPDLVDGQVCYVISSGEFYRWSAGDNQWHKIMDIGQTFRQGFLNSGLVIMDGEMTIDGNDIVIPESLVYFKNQEGDGRYLRGMYKILAARYTVNTTVNGAFSIRVDSQGMFDTVPGLIAEDDVNRVFLGSFIVANHQLFNVYTLPDIAYTADRGHFFIDGGQAEGLVLVGKGGQTLGRGSGYYYDEGAHYVNDKVNKYAEVVDSATNLNLKHFEEESTIETLYYIYPENAFEHNIDIISDGQLQVTYLNNGVVTQLPQGFFTIQRHLITPKGEDFFIYGDKAYNSIEDALEHLNDPFGLDVEFPYVESCRLIIGAKTTGTTDTSDGKYFQVKSLSRLSQVGTFTPEFSDASFKIFSAAADNTPASLQFNLHNLDVENYNYQDSYKLYPLTYKYLKQDFALTEKFVDIGEDPEQVIKDEPNQYRSYNDTKGYEIASNADVSLLRSRIEEIEKEIWAVYDEDLEQYEQSLRYRTSTNEKDIRDIQSDLDGKVDKTFKINGIALNDPSGGITLDTDDIPQGSGTEHRWTTNTQQTQWNMAYSHATTYGTAVQDMGRYPSTGGFNPNNPHRLSTEDIYEKGEKLFVSATQHDAIENLPPNTAQAIEGKIGPIPVYTIAGTALNPGERTRLPKDLTERGLYIYNHGANVSYEPDGKIILECVGQLTRDNVLTYDDFARKARDYGGIYAGKVDHAVKADEVSILDNAQPAQYYGTNVVGTPGVFDLPVYVSSASAEEYQDVTQSYFLPIDKSVTLAHLGNSKVTYPARSEEAKTGTNVYDLVTKHYHKVFNSGVQGPYIDGSQTQDTSKIYYEYKIPAEGLDPDDYYFSYENDNYRFTLSNGATAGQILRYAPYTDLLTLDGATIQKDPVAGEIVDENMWLPLVSVTDWNNINEWNFGNNLTVSVTDGRATINANVAGHGQFDFVNLNDVYLEYNDNNLGKMPILNKINGEYKLTWGVANMNNIMSVTEYVGDTATKQVHSSELADSATTAGLLQNLYSVNDGSTSATTLWTSSRIVQEINAGVKVYSGTTTPSSSIGKNGDLYILLDE